ncbi:hypothetical protein ZWY2020_040266 [Hordeum vulgare]|nr:hypothetical protein ZWY2020_040266 [Hordeum vulgare]
MPVLGQTGHGRGRSRAFARRQGPGRSRGRRYQRGTGTTSSCSTCSLASGMPWEGNRRRLHWISNHQHLIQKRRCGQGFLEGSKHTPPHQSCDFRWKDYCPLVFRTLRKLFDVDPADYMISICGDDALLELSSPGKSGSFFYLTNDDKYMIKTMKKAEVKVLLRMLPAYYKHVRAYDNTLITKFFGLHCVKITGGIQKKVRFVIMGNLFCSRYAIHRRFDLKGSSLGRMTDKPLDQIDETTTLKDLDLNFIFRLAGSWFQEFCRQVDRDCELLEQERIMDYSLLVGVHFKDRCKDTGNADNGTPTTTDEDSEQKRKAQEKLGISMPSRVENIVRNPESESLLISEPTGEFRT